MDISLSDSERELLREVLEERMGTLRQEVYHAEEPAFKDRLKEQEKSLAALLAKLS
ncbi:MAG: hypothetical protein KGO96_12140 [Elusimicrobia bacterium]|nr:hypothetical protein [Elusimicrobiota bacterium]MDE2426646.1 hypothetical protein [Elusimicrobiota bacterium]